MYFAPLQNLLKQTQKYSPETRLRFSEIYAEEMTVLHVGQCWDIVWHNTEIRTDTIPTVEQYLQMTAHKTGGIIFISSFF
jgi:geranylgeranyl diphosphate synthase type 3/geranylgeranyl diphosphate synthase type I